MVEQQSYFGVFDGHGGAGCAQFCRDTLHHKLLASPALSLDPAAALVEAFTASDAQFIAQHGVQGDTSGTTAIVGLLRGEDLFIGNLGDCRAVLSHNGKALELSEDQKPTLTREQERIRREGGTVEFGCLNGELRVSRAVGDFDPSKKAKPAGLSNIAEVLSHRLIHPVDEFLVLASDGLWDVMGSQTVISALREDLIRDGDVQQAAEDLVHKAVKGPFYSEDNVTAVVVSFLSEERRQGLRKELERAKSAAKSAAGAGKSAGKWVPKGKWSSRRPVQPVQLDADTAGLKDLAAEPGSAAAPGSGEGG